MGSSLILVFSSEVVSIQQLVIDLITDLYERDEEEVVIGVPLGYATKLLLQEGLENIEKVMGA